MKNIKLSALNLVPIREGQEDKDAINDMVTLAQEIGRAHVWTPVTPSEI